MTNFIIRFLFFVFTLNQVQDSSSNSIIDANCPVGYLLNRTLNACIKTTPGTIRPFICSNGMITISKRPIEGELIASIQRPAEVSCSDAYSWSGTECVRQTISSPECLNHDRFGNGSCQRIENGFCSRMYRQIGQECVRIVEHNPVCENDEEIEGNRCVRKVLPTCPHGYSLTNGYCQKYSHTSCRLGYDKRDGDGSKCYKTIKGAIQCQPDYRWNGDRCAQTYQPHCTDSKRFNGIDQCIGHSTEPPTYKCRREEEILIGERLCSRCPANTVKVNENCKARPTCQEGYCLIGDQCYGCGPGCPLGYEMVNDLCKKIGVDECPSACRLICTSLSYCDNRVCPTRCRR